MPAHPPEEFASIIEVKHPRHFGVPEDTVNHDQLISTFF